ncbi:uncharacterized protein L3040_006855 [Drepanopeziza brunnea f. sp. 'multigermtubi']|nr:hypothetical protein L3040_006855 [Drepanopeziza brunnea f. sp. 'multigermtubi']
MADTAQDEAAKARIIKHMNEDHAESLSYYLQHYCQLSASAARRCRISAITLSSMTLQTSTGHAHTIPFDPPMKSYSEARARSVQMDRAARAALDISPIRITAYEPPRGGVQAGVFATCLFTIVVLATHRKMVPGTWVYDGPLQWFPGGAATFVGLARLVFWPFIAIHLFESWWLNRTRLRRYGVEVGTALWWKWIVSCCVEGFGCFQRIDATVRRKTKEAEKAKH